MVSSEAMADAVMMVRLAVAMRAAVAVAAVVVVVVARTLRAETTQLKTRIAGGHASTRRVP
jgi:hypothetical protein